MIRFGFSSAGGFIENGVLPLLADVENLEVIAISDKLNHERLGKVAEKFGIKNTYPDYNDMLRNDDIDAIYVCSPNAFHKELTVAAAQAGKHVICEKPMALNANECREMISACQANNVRLAVDFCYIYAGPQIKIKQMIDDGVLGKICHMHFSINMCGFTKEVGGWRCDPKISGGGPLMDCAPHVLNMACFFADDKVKSVMANVKPEMTTTDVETDVSCLLEFVGGATATIETSFTRAMINNLMVIGDKASIRGTCTISWRVGGSLEMLTLANEFEPENMEFEKIEGIANHFRTFADAIENDKPIFSDGHAGLHTQQIIDAIYQSGKTGRKVILR